MSVETELLAMIQSGAAFPATTLMPMYERLEPVSAEFMLGTWKGGLFDGGAGGDPLKWYGKRFTSMTDVDPMMCYKEDGSIYSWPDWGMAQLREVNFRGKVSASLIYDSQPIMDYFRKVTQNVVLGLGDIKGKPTDFFFHLTRA
jgi:hypothetical protein